MRVSPSSPRTTVHCATLRVNCAHPLHGCVVPLHCVPLRFTSRCVRRDPLRMQCGPMWRQCALRLPYTQPDLPPSSTKFSDMTVVQVGELSPPTPELTSSPTLCSFVCCIPHLHIQVLRFLPSIPLFSNNLHSIPSFVRSLACLLDWPTTWFSCWFYATRGSIMVVGRCDGDGDEPSSRSRLLSFGPCPGPGPGPSPSLRLHIIQDHHRVHSKKPSLQPSIVALGGL